MLSQSSITLQLYIWHSILGIYACMYAKVCYVCQLHVHITGEYSPDPHEISCFLGFTVITNHMVCPCVKITRYIEFHDASRTSCASMLTNTGFGKF